MQIRPSMLALVLLGSAAATAVLVPAAFSARAPQKPQNKAGQLTIEVPAEVQATLLRETAGGKIVDFRRAEDRDGGEGYLVVARIKARPYVIHVSGDGRLVSKHVQRDDGEDGDEPRDREVAYDQLPQVVREALVDEVQGGSIKRLSKHECQTFYTTEVVIGGEYYVIRTAPDGTLLSKYLDRERAEQVAEQERQAAEEAAAEAAERQREGEGEAEGQRE